MILVIIDTFVTFGILFLGVGNLLAAPDRKWRVMGGLLVVLGLALIAAHLTYFQSQQELCENCCAILSQTANLSGGI